MKRFAQIVGLLLGVFLLAGVLPENGDSGLARITYLRASAVIGNSSSLATDPPASFSLSPGDTPAPNSTTSNPLSAGDGHIRLVSSVLPDDTVERDLKSHARPSPTVLANAAVPVLPLDGFDLYIHFPTDADQRQPLRVVVALHGMGSRGDVFAQSLVAEADQNGWLLVAPTLPYGDYMDPTRLAEEDVRLSQMLQTTLNALPQRLGVKLQPRVIIFGFSRGAQLGHRFALFYPERVEAVAALSAGTYTLPTDKATTASGVRMLPLPYGVGDVEQRLHRPMNLGEFKKISFFIGVGEKDNRAIEVPRGFDTYVGTTRVERAQTFHRALQDLGMRSTLVVFPNAGHEISGEMHARVVRFLKDNAPVNTLRR